jgi:pimeloyl-ACP methyl ester carboxylesterase
MAIFVLVPGGDGRSSFWDQVAPLLEAKGHRVHTPTLADQTTSTLTDHIAQVSVLVEDAGTGTNDVILVGHSYGGVIITGVSGTVHDRIRRLIYLDTVYPSDGVSLFDHFARSGVDPTSFDGLEPFPSLVEPLRYDVETWRSIPKTYVHCTRSEFLSLTAHEIPLVQARLLQDNWEYDELDSGHVCMFDEPDQTAAILMRHA